MCMSQDALVIKNGHTGLVQSVKTLNPKPSSSKTYPPSILPADVCLDKPRTDLIAAMEECKMTMTGAVEGLLRKTGLQAQDIDILVTT